MRLESTQTRAVNVTLEVGSATAEEVNVTAEAPLVETSQARVSRLIEEQQVKDLPLVGRNFFNLVVLTPGVTGRVTGGTQSYAQSNADLYNNEFGVGMNANGGAHGVEQLHGGLLHRQLQPAQRRRQHQPERGERGGGPRPREQLLRGVRPQRLRARERDHQERRQQLPRQPGRVLHERLDAVEELLPEAVRRTSASRTSAARRSPGDFGGPIRKDKTFFFVSGDVLRSDVAVSGTASILTPQFIQFMQQARPNNLSTRIARDFPASFTPDRNFRTAGQILGSSCSGGPAIDSPHRAHRPATSP